MREISPNTKHKVVKLFLNGSSYDEIAHQVGIAKGSVVNIISEFREGHLQVPRDLTEYIDALRQVAVDLRKHNTSIAQVQSCLKLDIKLREMGVNSEKAEDWLDICHDMASPGVSTDRFVAAAVELSRVALETGLSYGEVLDDYNAKLGKSRELSKEIEWKEQQLAEDRASHREQKEQATKELNAITKAIGAAQDMFRKQKDDLKAQMNEYLTQHKLSWKKVNTVLALLDTELGRAGMAKADVKRLSKRIYDAGSLVNVVIELKKEKESLQSEADRLTQENEVLTTSTDELKNIDESLRKSTAANEQKLDGLNTELNSKKLELEEIQDRASRLAQDIHTSRLIIDFLSAPGSIRDYDLDRLVSLMIGLRQKRLGIGPKQATDRDGKVICECQLPRIRSSITMGKSEMDEARERLAYLIAPLVKDEFISKSDYRNIQFKHMNQVLDAVLNERKRHLF